MSAEPVRLWRYGVLLLFLSLVNGVLIGVFTNPRAALSAHLTGIEGSLVLVAFGFLWPKLNLTRGQARTALNLSVVGMYSLWVAFLLAAALGTSGSTPISGEGFAGAASAELVVSALLYLGSVASLVGVGLVLFGLRSPGT